MSYLQFPRLYDHQLRCIVTCLSHVEGGYTYQPKRISRIHIQPRVGLDVRDREEVAYTTGCEPSLLEQFPTDSLLYSLLGIDKAPW